MKYKRSIYLYKTYYNDMCCKYFGQGRVAEWDLRITGARTLLAAAAIQN